MRKSQIGFAVTMALAGAQALAAVTPADTELLYMSGATATDRTLFEAMLDPGIAATSGICTDGTTGVGGDGIAGTADDTFDPATIVDVYTSASSWSTTGPNPANFSIHCVGKSTSTQIAVALRGANIGLYKFSGGSETGVDPVANGTSTLVVNGSTLNITFADPASATCSAATFVPQRIGTTSDRVAYRVFTGCGRTAPIVPNAGVSDVNVAVFGVSATTASRLASDTAVTISFAPVLSKNFYAALQTALGLQRLDTATNTLVACTSDIASAVESCMPNLSYTQAKALMGGPGAAGTDTRVIKLATQVAAGGTALTAPAASNNIRFCRRGDQSGTQKSFEVIYFGQNCGVTTFSRMAEAPAVVDASGNLCENVGCSWNATTFGSADFFQGTGSGDVEDCVDHADDNNRYAVGLLSTDRIPNDGSDEWRYIKLSGATPTVDAVVNGEWEHFTENVFLRPTGGVNTTLTANRLSLYNGLLSGVRTPATLAKTHAIQTFGRTGLAVRPVGSAAPLAGDTAAARPVAALLRGASRGLGTVVNNCIAPQQSVNGPTPDPLKFSRD